MKTSATKQFPRNNIYTEQYQNKMVLQRNHQNNEITKENENQPHSIYPPMQVTVQSLTKPLQSSRNQPVQIVAPIVYSFRQPNYANYANNKSVQTIANGHSDKEDLDNDGDNFTDVLGYGEWLFHSNFQVHTKVLLRVIWPYLSILSGLFGNGARSLARTDVRSRSWRRYV